MRAGAASQEVGDRQDPEHDESADGYSGFDGTNLADLLRDEGVKEIWVGGLATDYCVKETALDGLRLGFAVEVLTTAARAVDLQPGDGLRALAAIEAAGGRLL